MKLSKSDYIDLNGSGNSTGSYIKPHVEVGSTATSFKNYGITTIPFPDTDTARYTLDAPSIGISKRVLMYSTTLSPGSTDTAVFIGTSTDVTLLGSTAYFSKDDASISMTYPWGMVDLVGISTSAWLVTGQYGNVSYSTATSS